MIKQVEQHGGNIVAEILQQHNTKWIFTLCGGHISPILTGCNELGIRVVDVRHESTAVFAAEAVSRLSGTIGIAAVTAGPGFTNTITAIKNAQLAQVPLLIISGATATVLKNKGSLQDIDHISVVKSITKFAKTIKRVNQIRSIMNEAISIATSGVQGPVYLEFPVDILYPESIVKQWYGLKSKNKSMPWWMSIYLNWNVKRIFENKNKNDYIEQKNNKEPDLNDDFLYLSQKIKKADNPILLIGSQSNLNIKQNNTLANAIKKINIPTFVSGMARGLLSKTNLPIYRHERTKALKESDLVILAGVPCDFRLDYGRMINHSAKIISINLSRRDLYLNRNPLKAIQTNPGLFLIKWAESMNNLSKNKWVEWHKTLLIRNNNRINNIKSQSESKAEFVNPLKLCMEINPLIEKGDIIVADGGDFVATASYILQPRSLGGWLDPGVFGTLGVGGGFILGAQLTQQKSIVWAIFGDGAFGYSLMEFDTYVRHNIPVIAIIGNDSSWSQIARDQIDILRDPISTELAPTDYQKAVEGLGGKGFLINDESKLKDTLLEAKESAKSGNPTIVNVRISKTDFRKGSISI